MDNFNTTWISTVTGTGTTWTFSIVKEIFNYRKLNVLPKKVYKSEKGFFNIYKKNALLDQNSNNHYVLQCHAILTLHLIQARCKVITNIRNPYDNCASHYEFMKCDVEAAIKNALHIPLLIEHYSKLDEEKFFLLKYEHIDDRPVELINRLAEFLQVELDQSTAVQLAERYSRESIKKIIAKNEKSLVDKLLSGKEVLKDEIVIREGGSRIDTFDLNTGYQSNQISQRKTGEWRSAFSKPQIKEIIAKLDQTAKDLGYASEKL